MVTDRQVRRLMQLMETGEKLMVAALKTGMVEKTAKCYVKKDLIEEKRSRLKMAA